MKRFWDRLEGEHKGLLGVVAFMWVAQFVLLVSPIDPIPDLIPVLGYVDDLLRLIATVALTVYAYRAIGYKSFAELVPQALRPSAEELSNPLSGTIYEETTPEHEDIPGYRPLSLSELRSL
ncbi:MAG: DUF1232 domain-containing protein [Deltaproteobacteria bacterium]|nr:MAG: DUF1232 domain-containing protein [Deltaproteobacteria bacterium]